MWATCLAIGQRSGQRPTSERSRGSLSNRAPGEDFVTENADLGESGDNGYNHGDGCDNDDKQQTIDNQVNHLQLRGFQGEPAKAKTYSGWKEHKKNI